MTSAMSHVEGHESSLGIGAGLSAFAGGIGFVIGTPRVWIYALVPMAVMVVVTLLLTALFVWGGLALTGWVVGEPESTWARIGIWLVKAMVVLFSVLVGAIVALSVAQPLSGFALEAVSRAQQVALTGKAPAPQPILQAMVNTARIVFMTLLVGTPLLAILFIITLLFPPAAIVTIPVKFVLCAWLLAWDFLDYPTGLRGMGLRARLAWVRRNMDAFTTFGICWAMLVIIPGIVLVVLPMAVAGATRMVVEDERNCEAIGEEPLTCAQPEA
jgi:CysZ protein